MLKSCCTDQVLLHFVVPAAPLPKRKPDMVLEDVESDNECQQKREAPPASQAAAREQRKSISEQPCSAACSEPAPPENKSSQEDAETQTGRWTPFVQSIKKEAEDGVLATMEER